MDRERYSSNLASAPEDILLGRIAAGDVDALEAMYDRYSGPVYGLARHLLGDTPAAEDIVQETFWRIWRRADSFQSARGNVVTWMFSITRNLCIDEIRRQQRQRESSYDGASHPPPNSNDTDTDIAALVVAREDNRSLKAALRSLPVERRQVLEMAYFGGMTQREIAMQLHQPLGTIKARVRAGLLHLRRLLACQELPSTD